MKKSRLFSLILSAALMPVFAPVATAQNLFAPVATIDDHAVTRFEHQQRIKLLEALGTIGDLNTLALDQLIDERLRLGATRGVGIEADLDSIEAGITEFASRANLSPDALLAELARDGVAPETLRDFIATGIEWRTLVRAKFSSQAGISEAEVDRALSQSGQRGSIQVLLSEIIIPADERYIAQTEPLSRQLAQIKTFAGFNAAAKKYSVSGSRAAGGQLSWTPISELPPALRPVVLALEPGEVTEPIKLTEAFLLFQMRQKAELTAPETETLALDYAVYRVAGAGTDAGDKALTKLENATDTCDDLYGAAKGQPEGVLAFETRQPADVDGDIRYELSKLDAGETSTALTRDNGQTALFLMLCGRTVDAAGAPTGDREVIRSELRSQRLASLADGYLAELTADAVITRK